VGYVSFLLYQNYQHKKQDKNQNISNSSSVTTSSKTAESNNIFLSTVKSQFQEINKKYNGKVVDTENLSIWWISTDGLNIINDNSLGVQLNIFNCEADLASHKTFKEISQLLSSKINEIMIQNGFTKNLSNSSTSIDDDKFYDYIQAYENKTIKAIFTANPDCIASDSNDSNTNPKQYSFSFGYTTNFDKNYEQQSQYLKDLAINNAVIRAEKKVGDFAILNVAGRRSGYSIIAKLIDGKWQNIHSGQSLPSCEVVNKYQIPKEIVADCI
jgi:hypothetical protein